LNLGASGSFATAGRSFCIAGLLLDTVRLLPQLTRPEIAELFSACEIMVSPSQHDGTPNTLLESMARGAFPVVGDIESVREWITHGRNGLLFDPDSARSFADAVLAAMDDDALRHSARQVNSTLIAERAHHQTVMAAAESLYGLTLDSCRHRIEARAAFASL
jgi:glycosyltransferase involved in cell wall biosynthesis